MKEADNKKLPGQQYKTLNQFIRAHKHPTKDDKIKVATLLIENFDETDEQQVQDWCKKFKEFPLIGNFSEIRWGTIFCQVENFIKLTPIFQSLRTNMFNEDFYNHYDLAKGSNLGKYDVMIILRLRNNYVMITSRF